MAARPYQRARDDPQITKRAVNMWIAECAARLQQQSGGGSRWALALESRHLLTLQALRAADCGVAAETMVVPNPDATEIAAITKAEPELHALPLSSHQLLRALVAEPVTATATVATSQTPAASPPASVRSALQSQGWRGAFSVVWLDYCGTLGAARNNKLARQRLQDIELLLEHRLLLVQEELCSGSWAAALLAVTFTTRGASELYRGELLDTLLLTVTGLARRYSQEAQAVGAVSYSQRGSGGPPTREVERPSLHTVLFTVRAAAQAAGGGSPAPPSPSPLPDFRQQPLAVDFPPVLGPSGLCNQQYHHRHHHHHHYYY